jgi:hypothetical protein
MAVYRGKSLKYGFEPLRREDFRMSFSLALAIGAMLMALVVAGYAIWQYGPGVRRRSVRCPVLRKRAKVLVDQREAEFFCSYAGLKAVDLTDCSLMNGALTCGKECLQNL